MRGPHRVPFAEQQLAEQEVRFGRILLGGPFQPEPARSLPVGCGEQHLREAHHGGDVAQVSRFPVHLDGFVQVARLFEPGRLGGQARALCRRPVLWHGRGPVRPEQEAFPVRREALGRVRVVYARLVQVRQFLRADGVPTVRPAGQQCRRLSRVAHPGLWQELPEQQPGQEATGVGGRAVRHAKVLLRGAPQGRLAFPPLGRGAAVVQEHLRDHQLSRGVSLRGRQPVPAQRLWPVPGRCEAVVMQFTQQELRLSVTPRRFGLQGAERGIQFPIAVQGCTGRDLRPGHAEQQGCQNSQCNYPQ